MCDLPWCCVISISISIEYFIIHDCYINNLLFVMKNLVSFLISFSLEFYCINF